MNNYIYPNQICLNTYINKPLYIWHNHLNLNLYFRNSQTKFLWKQNLFQTDIHTRQSLFSPQTIISIFVSNFFPILKIRFYDKSNLKIFLSKHETFIEKENIPCLHWSLLIQWRKHVFSNSGSMNNKMFTDQPTTF